MGNLEQFRELLFKEEKKNTLTCKHTLHQLKSFLFNLFFLYMIIINVFSLFYTNFFTPFLADYNFNLKQNTTNYTYNSVCIITTIMFMINIKFKNRCIIEEKPKKKTKSFIDDLTHFYFIFKINLDFFNLFYLTPPLFVYKIELCVLFIYLTFFNLIFYFLTMKKKIIDTKISNILTLLIILAGLSSLLCYLLYYDGVSIKNLIFNEVSKIIVYLFIFILNLSSNISIKSKKEFKTRLIFLKDLSLFMYSSLENSRWCGLVIVKNSDKYFSTSTYFDNIYLELFTKRENSRLKSIKSLHPNSFKGPSIMDFNHNSGAVDNNGMLKRLEVNSSDHSSNSGFDNRAKCRICYNKQDHKPFSSKNVLRNLGDFKMKLPQRRNLSTQSINLIQDKNNELDDIKEEKDENEISYAYPKNSISKKTLTLKKLSLESTNTKQIQRINCNSDKRIFNNENNKLNTSSNIYNPYHKKGANNRDTKKRTQPILVKETFLKALGSRLITETKKQIFEEKDDSSADSDDSSSFVNKPIVHEIQKDVLEIFAEREEGDSIFNAKPQKRSASDKLNSIKILDKLHELTENEDEPIIRKNTKKKISKFSKIFDETVSSKSENDSIFNDKPRRKSINHNNNLHTIKLLKNLQDMSMDKSQNENDATRTKKMLKVKKSGNYLNIFKDKGSSGDEFLFDFKPHKRSISNNQNTIKLLQKVEDMSMNYHNLRPKSEVDSDNSVMKRTINKLDREGIISSDNKNDNKSENNIVVNNNYNINIYNNNDSKNQPEMKSNVNVIPWRSDNGLSINYFPGTGVIQNLAEGITNFDLCSSNFTLNLSINNFACSNLQLIITYSTFTSAHEIKNEKLRNKIFILNKSLGLGVLLSIFMKKLYLILEEDESYTDDLELGPYVLSLGDISSLHNSHKENEVMIESIYQTKKYVTISLKKIVLKNELFYYYIFKDYKNVYINNLNNQFLKPISRKRNNSTNSVNLNNMMNGTGNGTGNGNCNSHNRQKSFFIDNNESCGVIHTTSPHMPPSQNNSLINNMIFKNIPNNANFSSSVSMDNIVLYNAKISALLHDFKHTIIDGRLFHEYIFLKYNVNIEEDDLIYMKVMDDYFNSLIFNITCFMKDSDLFFKGTPDENNQQVDLISIIELMVKIFNRRLQWEIDSCGPIENSNKRKIKIFSKINNGENPSYRKIISNKNLLISLFYNLMSNSFKATREGEIIIETEINENEIVVKLSDTGSGLPDKVLKNWNKPFNMEVKNCNKADSGTGLGQFIMAAIAKNLKYEMPLPERNPNGQGTVFKIVIPIYDNIIRNINPNYNSSSNGTGKGNNFNLINSELHYQNQSNSNVTGSLATRRRATDPLVVGSDDRENVNYSQETEFGPLIFNNRDYYINVIPLNNESSCYNPRTYYILCFDDDPIIINTVVQKLKTQLCKFKNNIKFEFDIAYNFEMFYDKFSKNLSSKKYYHFFILDQNISIQLKGVEIAEMVDKTYNAYFGNHYGSTFVNYLFVTEQAESLKYYFDQLACINPNDTGKRMIFNYEQVFGKRDHDLIGKKIIQLVMAEMNNS